MVDLHCHILPGIDDGSKTLKESVEMCRRAAADGIRAIVATPHRNSFVANTTVSQVLNGIKQLKKALARNSIDIDILPGHEIHISNDLIDEVERGESLTINRNEKYILLELPMRSVPFYVFDCVAQLKGKGITAIIIAHPERNAQIQADKRVMKRLIKAGALSQVTGGSLLGEFGPTARRCAVELLKNGLAHVIASDAHSAARRYYHRLSPRRRRLWGRRK
jgi:protein-tyrosine phosphatase